MKSLPTEPQRRSWSGSSTIKVGNEFLFSGLFIFVSLQLSNEPASVLLRTSIIYTDGFLLVSGVLTAFNLTKEITSTGRITWIRRLISRVIRLTPSLLAVILFYGYIAEEIGSGPLWSQLVGTNAEMCRRNSWANLLYIQNFFDFQEMVRKSLLFSNHSQAKQTF